MTDQRDARWHEPVPGAAAHAGANERAEDGVDDAARWQTPPAAPEERGLEGDPTASAGDVVHSATAPSGLATSASGGYGTGSGGEVGGADDMPTSGGSGDGDERTSQAGEEAETDWLRRAQGGPR